MDEKKLEQIAKNIVNYSIKVKKGEKTFILAWQDSQPLVKAIIKEINNVGGLPFVIISDDSVDAEILKGGKEAYEQHWLMYGEQFKQADKMINIRSINTELLATAGEVGGSKLDLMRASYRNATEKSPWVLLNYPTSYMAKQFNKSQKDMEDFWLFACGFDYSKMAAAAEPLKQLMNKTDKVQIKGPGTDLTFSIKGLESEPCCGLRNIPDGECYSAPVKDSVNGTIQYNTLTPYGGTVFKDVKFTFKDGKIVEATCKDKKNVAALNKILDTDEGSRYIGEFAIGFNPFIKEAVGNILFDEKMMGSIHFTPGQSYKNQTYNGNDSKIHWDIVLSQVSSNGGGEILFDDVLIRKDGIFVLDELKGLNPDQLGK